MRGAVVWDFETHPARTAIGKLGVYFWLGLFEAEPTKSLFPARLSIAVFSLITAAGVYMIGRALHKPITGYIALGLYAILPLSFFYERLAMADPFAAGWAILVIWRTMAMVKRPTLWNGFWVGITVGCGTIAKMTMGGLPAIPVGATLIYLQWHSFRMPFQKRNVFHDIKQWLFTYFPPLTIAGIITILLWLPILIPAYIADQEGEPFRLLGEISYYGGRDHTNLSYTERIVVEVYDFTDKDFLQYLGIFLGIGYVAIVFAAWFGKSSTESYLRIRHMLFIGVWFASVTVVIVLKANLPSSRYFMPISAPLVVLIAYLLTMLWSMSWLHKIVAASFGVILVSWAVNFVNPWLDKGIQDTGNLPVTEGTANYEEFMRGMLMAEDGVRAAAVHLNQLDSAGFYAGWKTCSLLYYYVEQPVLCLPIDSTQIFPTLKGWLEEDIQTSDDYAYLILADYGSDSFRNYVGRSLGYWWKPIAPIPDLQVRPALTNRAYEKEKVCYVREKVFRPICIFRISLPDPYLGG